VGAGVALDALTLNVVRMLPDTSCTVNELPVQPSDMPNINMDQ
jgi:hypothetical protein